MNHCWHWTGRTIGSDPERTCCWCGWFDLAIVTPEDMGRELRYIADHVADGVRFSLHGMLIPGDDANGPKSAAGHDDHQCSIRGVVRTGPGWEEQAAEEKA